MGAESRRILLVAQLAPPSPLVEARRVAGLTKYLARRGFEITVLASVLSGEGEIDGAARTIRTPDLMSTPLNWRRGHFEALSGTEAASYRPPSRLQAALVPDIASYTWLPFAASAAARVARRERIGCVLTTAPARAAHLVGLWLKRRRRLPWIAEFRDGWTFERADSWPTGGQRRLDAFLERAVVQAADAVVGVTAPIADDLRARFGADAHLITNGFDPEEEPAGELEQPLEPDHWSLVYTGRIAYSGLSAEPLAAALRRLHGAPARATRRLRVIFAGPLTDDERRLLTSPDLAEIVRLVGSLDREHTLGLQRAADALLVITRGAERRSVATGKLFEYLAAGPPILVLGDETEAARIVSETSTGVVTSATDPEEIAAALVAVMDLTSPPRGGERRERVKPYAYPQIARRYEELIEDVIAGCQRGSSTGLSASTTS